MEFIRLSLGYGQMNCYILYNNGEAAIIDPGFDFETIKDFLLKKNLDPKYILLTHSHGDHIGAVEELKLAYPNAELGIHEAEVEMLKDPELNLSKMIQTKEVSLTPDFTFKDGDIIKLGSEEIEVIHTPGHSPGGSCFKVDNDIFVGDTIFKMSISRTDLYMGDQSQLINSIETKILTQNRDAVLYPGHGSETTVGFEQERNPFLQ